ncbi:MAG TPA: rRNA maturation RNase YbeY [Myxococcaceae bacterium]|nr:rRNA maturation RNase YbeY [Myxococcaceae bacterium]
MDGKDDLRLAQSVKASAASPRRARNRVALEVKRAGAKSSAQRLRSAARLFLRRLGVRGAELSICLVGDAAIRRLNRTWRRIDRPTDVLSFPAGQMPGAAQGPKLLGDVVISVDTARRRAGMSRRALDAELARYLAHGLLHLLGYDHHTRAQAASMAKLEESLLGERGLI